MPTDHLTDSAAEKFDLLSIGFDSQQPILQAQRRKLRLGALMDAERFLNESAMREKPLHFAVLVAEKFEGLGRAFKVKSKVLKLNRGQLARQIYVQETAICSTVMWIGEIGMPVLLGLECSWDAVGILICKNSLLDKAFFESINLVLQKYNFTASKIRASALTDDFFGDMATMTELAGFFCFSGDYDDNWSDLLVFLKKK